MNTEQKEPYQSWHLDKRVPIALILTLIMQFAGVVLYVSRIEAQGADNERRISALESQKISERLAALESQVGDVKAYLARMESKLDRIVERK